MRVAAAAAAVVLGALPASAAPKTAAARAGFERGVRAYKAGDYLTAANAFNESLTVEEDIETMFALAQSYRQLGKCETALEFYNRLLAHPNLPSANRVAVTKAKAECNEIIENARRATAGSDAGGDAGSDTGDVDTGSDTAEPPAVQLTPEGTHVWWKEPIGDALTGVGLTGLAIGAGYYLESQNAYDAISQSTSDTEYHRELVRAQNDHDNAVVAAIGGGAFFIAGFAWYATHRQDDAPRRRHHHRAVTGWLDGRGGGLTVLGSF